jgi:hypothetical protein
MRLPRTALVMLAITPVLSGSALAGPIGVGAGIGAHGGAVVGAPPIGVPPAHVPPVTVPPVSVPKPQAPVAPARTDASSAAHVSTHSVSAKDANVLHGTITSVNGVHVAVQLSSSGSVQTYTVSPQTATQLQSYLNKHVKNVAFRVQNGVLALVGQGTPPLQGSVESVNGSTVQIKLANGTTQSYTVTAQQAAWLQAHVGKNVAFWASSNDTIELDQRSHASTMSQRRTRKTPH